MATGLQEILQPYILRFKQDFPELEEETSTEGKTGLERREYVKNGVQRLFSEETVDHVTEDELVDLLDSTTAMFGYIYDSTTLLESIGLDTFLTQIKELLYGRGDLADRYAEFINGTKNVGPALTSELLCSFSPNEYACLNGTAEKALKILGLDTMTAPKTGKKCGEYYREFNEIAGKILAEIREDADPLLQNADYSTLDYFLYSVATVNFWKIAPGQNSENWDLCKSENIIAVGGEELVIPYGEAVFDLTLEELKEKYAEKVPESSERSISNQMSQYYCFLHDIKVGDLVLANRGYQGVHGWGVIVSGPKVQKQWKYPTYREVKWRDTNETIVDLKKFKRNFQNTTVGLSFKEFYSIVETDGVIRTENYWVLLPSSRTQETYAPLKHWDEWQEKGIIGIPWEMLAKKYGDTLFEFSDPDVFREKFREAIEGDPFEKPVNAYMPYDFLFTMQEGDTVVIPRGRQGVLGQATVVSGPKIDLALDFSIYREVRWEVFEKEIPVPYDLRGIVVSKRLKKITKDDYEALFHQETETMDTPAFRKITRLLAAKNQVVLYGPPGTGKTYTAQTYIAAHPGAAHAFVTFHPSFAYEDFIEGLRPRTDAEGRICYEIEDGIFKTLCRDAFNALMERAGIENRWEEGEDVPALSPREEAEALAVRDRVPVFLVIDEINRGDIPRIFGELITLLEKDKRLCTGNALATTLPYSKTRFGIPPNLFVIGTMNTADRSIALLDIALRRRFGFIEVMPDYAVLEEALTSDDPAVQEVFTIAINALRDVNARIIKNYDRNHQIGHSYLMKLAGCTTRDEAVEAFQTTWECEVIPLLQEYFYDSPQKFRECVGFDTAMPEDGEEFVRALSENRA
ncbi:AAA family ATPase [uncultured Methanofollis sp.]|mgnify:CR=1 FL=1|uniref:AAA family ATPase n=1 Tax=uncultured Methanofollis sp. TaxID=262500 RepID=UPI0026203BC9|nr:AAA family ATPase [uncultured Methanofollis sp.]